eukprot:1920728-Lingulodinium_polyedra.AAC.1
MGVAVNEDGDIDWNSSGFYELLEEEPGVVVVLNKFNVARAQRDSILCGLFQIHVVVGYVQFEL